MFLNGLMDQLSYFYVIQLNNLRKEQVFGDLASFFMNFVNIVEIPFF